MQCTEQSARAAFRENTDITNKCRMRILKYWTPRHGTSNATFASKFTVRKGQCSYIYSIGSALRVGEGEVAEQNESSLISASPRSFLSGAQRCAFDDPKCSNVARG